MSKKNLEQLLVETEQRITNKDFYKQYTLSYDGEEYEFYLKPLSQKRFMKLFTMFGEDNILELNTNLMQECIVREDGTQYPPELIQVLINEMPAGFSTEVITFIYELSGITPDQASEEQLQSFLETTFGL